MDSFNFQPLARSIKEHVEDGAFRFDSFKHTISDLEATGNDSVQDVEMIDADNYPHGTVESETGQIERGETQRDYVLPLLSSLSLKTPEEAPRNVPDIDMEDSPPMTPQKPSEKEQQKDYKTPEKVKKSSPVESPITARTLLSPTRLGAKLAVDNALVKYRESTYSLRQINPAVNVMESRSNSTTRSTPSSDPSLSSASSHLPMPTPVWIWHHHNVSYIISTYLQLLLNTVTVLIMLYLGHAILKAFWRDVDIKLDNYANTIAIEASQCTRNYLENDCRPGLRPPALESQCLEWEKCMERDPYAIGRLKISVETIAEVINGFIEPFSFRSLIVTVFVSLTVLYISNFVFGFFRARALVKDSGEYKSSGLLSHPPVRPPVLISFWTADEGQTPLTVKQTLRPLATRMYRPLTIGQDKDFDDERRLQ